AATALGGEYHRHQAIGFGGRVLSSAQEPKYLNSPTTPLFDKSKNLYGLNWAKQAMRKSNEVIITEGYTDVITAFEYKIENVVASLGTALTSQQAKILKRYVDRVYIAYDADSAGAKATLRGLNVLKNEGLNVKVISLGYEQDPDEYIKEEGKEKFLEEKENATSLIQFKIDQVLNDRDLSNVDERVNVVQEILPILHLVDDGVERNEYLRQVAEKLKIKLEVLRTELNKFEKSQQQDRKSVKRNNNLEESIKLNDPKKDGYQNAVEGLLKLMLNNSHLINRVKDRLDKIDFVEEDHRGLFRAIADLYQAKGKVETNELYNKLSTESAQKLLTKLSVQGDNFDSSVNLDKILSDYIKKIKGYQSGMKKEDLEVKIKQAEQDKNYQKLNQLLEEYQGLLRREEE
ncbi:MAG: toprim domain-containing protein, partial [Halanaerobacter sp.]